MMKLKSPSASNRCVGSAISRVFRAAFFSTDNARSNSLYQRITSVGDPKSSMVPLLDQWLEQGREVNESELKKIVKQLRKYRRFSHALQVQEWMTERMNYELTPGGTAIRLHLISKSHGLEKAEEYFNSIPSSFRVDKVHGAMLNCYVEKRSLAKAEEIFQKMKELGFANSSLAYNVMLNLYSHMEKYDKLESLVREMEENGVEADVYTFNTRLNAYAKTDVEKMERLLAEAEADSRVMVDFHAYFVAAKGYMRKGVFDKGLTMAKKAEEMISGKGNRFDYEHLVTLYAGVGAKDEVYRVWEHLKSKGKVFNTGYLSVLSSLLMVDDIDGAEKIFELWCSGKTGYDGRIVNLLISAYCKRGLLDKALACAERFTSKGHELDSSIWQCLATQCRVEDRMPKAVEMFKNAMVDCGPKSKPNPSTFAACVQYLKREQEKEAALKIIGMVRESGSFPREVCDGLVEFVNGAQILGPITSMLEKKNKKKKE